MCVTLGECYGHLADRGQESAKHHTMHRIAPPPGRIIWPKMSIMGRLTYRNLDLQNQYQKHPFDSVTYILECYYVPDTILGMRDMGISKSDHAPCLRVCIQKWETGLSDGPQWKHRVTWSSQGKDHGDFKIQESTDV